MTFQIGSPSMQVDNMADSQQNLSFALNQTTAINAKVYRRQYPDITYSQDIPMDYSTPEFAKSVTYFSLDGFGKAQWYNANAQDIPYSDTQRAKYEVEIADGAMGYKFNFFDMGQARMLNINLPAENAFYARRAYEEMMDEIAYLGNAAKKFEGLFNYTGITTVAAIAGLTSGNVTWALKTPDEILADFNNIILGIHVDSKNIEMADSFMVPDAQLAQLTSRRLGDTGETIWSFLMRSNVYTAKTGRQLNIGGHRRLAGAGVGGTDRLVGYRKDPEVLSMHVPMRFKFLTAQPDGLDIKVPGVFRVGGVDIRRTASVRYLDGI